MRSGRFCILKSRDWLVDLRYFATVFIQYGAILLIKRNYLIGAPVRTIIINFKLQNETKL